MGGKALQFFFIGTDDVAQTTIIQAQGPDMLYPFTEYLSEIRT
jgi:hypothetical protein